MPHTRKRYLEDSIKKTIQISPLIGILGHRQVGKTTLLEKISHQYFTMDENDELLQANQDPKEFIKTRAKPKTAIDECQMAPPLFPAFKEWVRNHKQPGQFFLSGSVRFTSLDLIKESLTGRIMNHELLPFSISEIDGRELPNRAFQALQSTSLENIFHEHSLSTKEYEQRSKSMRLYFKQGGLPGVFFLRNEKMRQAKIEQQLRTILDRDLRLVTRTTLSFPVLRKFVSLLAAQQGRLIDYTELKKLTNISAPTIKKLIFGLQAIFIIRMIPVEGGRKGEAIFFEDQGELFVLSPPSPLAALTEFCFTNIRAPFEYHMEIPTQCFQYRTRGNAYVPIVFQNNLGTLGILPCLEASEVQSLLGSANSFLKNYHNSKILILHPGKERKLIQPRVLLAPVVEFA